MNKPHLFKVEDWTPEEAGLLDEMKSRCLNKGQYIDEKAKDKFKMLCHLEDYGLQYYEQQKEIEELNDLLHKADDEVVSYANECIRLNNIIDELEKYLNDDDWTSVNGVIAIKLIKIKLKELKEGNK